MHRGERIYGAVLGVSMIAAVVWPTLADPPFDDFPLSNYPMFSEARDTANVFIAHVVAFDERGGGRVVPPAMLGTDEVMQARQTVLVAIEQGSQATGDLCRRVAGRLATARGAWNDAVRVEVRSDGYDAIAYFDGDTRSKKKRVFARCRVEPLP